MSLRLVLTTLLLMACSGGGDTDALSDCEAGCRETILRPCRDNCRTTCEGSEDFDRCFSLCAGDCLGEEAECVADTCTE